MCTSTRMSKNDMDATTAPAASDRPTNRKPLRRIRRRANPTTIAVEGDNCAQQEAAWSISNGEVIVGFYGKLNDGDESSPPSHEERNQKRRVARRRGGRPSRPDYSGRIDNKECHLLTFAERLEEQVVEVLAKQ